MTADSAEQPQQPLKQYYLPEEIQAMIKQAVAEGRKLGREEAARLAGAVSLPKGRIHTLTYENPRDLEDEAVGRCLNDNGLIVPTGTKEHHPDEHICVVCGETYDRSLRKIGRVVNVLHNP